MTPILAGLRRREITVQAGEKGARDMRFPVLLLAEVRLGEVVAAIEHAPSAEIRR